METKNIIICSSMNNKIKEFLESYSEENLKFTFLKIIDPLKIAFKVYTDENDNEKLVRKIKDLIKSTTFGSILYFSVIVDDTVNN
ncbi:hypothetical protein FDN13_03650 [Caloramator sp. E03]|uniref:hypothetical protein n=1 Tax=Caloramator sp. E03 TaxID=2576307 RepID=UPI001110DAAB|nr:hypothetical protein [Caloramator sp. E03]QCX32874.1 hypothetical protein FDN13_03650 [Caloramator sp. E03]